VRLFEAFSADAQRHRPAEAGRSVQHQAGDSGFGFLGRQGPSAEAAADAGLVADHRRFDPVAPLVCLAIKVEVPALVALAGDHRPDVPPAQAAPGHGAAVALVAGHAARNKRDVTWVGYKVQVTETCDPACEGPHLTANVETTPATTPDDNMVAVMHRSLEKRGSLPGEHLVERGEVRRAQPAHHDDDARHHPYRCARICRQRHAIHQ